ncbi:NfeD family protein [Pontiella agarivorans]|uniref:NfeD family protein n=1 Tax=Pontiella agarivorans TaxID=3038953 RepID=A0ABU5N0X0_9BACT|nr:NfeD family protein [Pontiella agarivorans]MDZ8120090.1 NfeD family protein [Pontiella agarivorans]
MLRTFLFTLAALLLSFPAKARETNSTPLVYIVPIKNMIEPALVYVVRRGVDEAVRKNADAIIFEMNTPGGAVNAAKEIIDIIGNTEIPTYTFIEQDAYSAGAIIAMATPNIYMAPGSVIGAATPMMMSPMGGVQDMPDEVQEKMTSAVAAMVRAAAEQGGYDPEMAEAMVRADMEYSVNGTVISKEGRLLTLTNKEAEQRVGEDNTPLLSKGTVKNIDDLLKNIELTGAEKRVLQVTAAEKLARLIASIAPILMMIGLGGLWLEFKTPGIGIFGIAGVTCLLLFFFGHHIAGLSGYEDLILFALGIGLLGLEIFVTPGFGVMGLSGLLLIFISFVSAMSERMPGSWRPIDFSPETFSVPLLKVMIAFIGTFIIAILAGKFLPETKALKSLTLQDVVPDPTEDNSLLDRKGTAHSDLRPGGTALIDGRKIDVVTRGDFIAHQTGIRVVEVHGNRIVVEKIS